MSIVTATKKLTENPLFIKELRIGLREKKVFFIQAIYLFVLGLVSFFYMMEMINQSHYNGYQEAGRNYFKVLCIVQWFLVVLISPSLTSTAISSEKEKSTFDLLMISLLGATDIILGKMAYAASYIFLLLASSLPLVALVFFVGGVSPWEIVINYLALFVWGVLVCLIGLFFSSREHRSSIATNQTYGAVILSGFFVTGLYISYIWETGLFLGFSKDPPEMMAWFLAYLDLLFLFAFLFFKIANYLSPRAKYILALHRLFIFIFSVNLLGAIGLDISSSMSSGTMSYNSSNGYLVWSIFTLGAIFFMGSFIERRRFISQKEEDTLNKSITSRAYFFPLFFGGATVFTAIIYSMFVPLEFGKIVMSAALALLFLIFMILITRDIYVLLNGKVRPVFIYFTFFPVMNLIPLFTWLFSINITGHSAKSSSLLSLIYLHPVFSIMSVWDDTEQYSKINCLVGEIPTWVLTFLVYFALYIAIKLLTTISVKMRK